MLTPYKNRKILLASYFLLWCINYLLKHFEIYSAEVSTVVSFFLIAYGIYILNKETKFKFKETKLILKRRKEEQELESELNNPKKPWE